MDFLLVGAGQILVFYLVFIKKMESHKSRATSIAILSFTSVVSLVYYLFKIKVSIYKCVIVAVTSIILRIFSKQAYE